MISNHLTLQRVHFSACLAAALVALSASAVDYWWTGGGNDGLWSTADNWATDAQGTPATAAPVRSDKANYYFDVPAGGLVVTQDDIGGILVSNLVVTTSATDPVELKIVSAAQDNEFEFCTGASIDVGAGVTLVLNTDMGKSTITANLPKAGAGTLVFDLAYRQAKVSRTLTIKEGLVRVLPTSKNPRFTVKLAGTDSENPPVFDNQLDNGLYSQLADGGIGAIRLNDTTLNVADPSNNDVATNTIPTVSDAGTLSFGNERIAKIKEASLSYNLAIDRADVLLPDSEALVCWTFDDANNPKRDDRGQGGRFLTNGSGTPTVVTDAERGNVLSLDGTYGFKGPDASTWLNGFEPKNGFTVAFWMKPDSSAVARAKILWWGAMAAGQCSALRLHDGSEGNLFFNLTSTGSSACYFPVTSLRNGAWHHIAVVFDSAQGKFHYYYDGAHVKEAEFSDTYNPKKQQLYIGNIDGSAWGTGNDYKGLMDDFLLAARAFSAEEIATIKEQGIASFKNEASLKALAANSGGVLSTGKRTTSLKTLSGTALAGGVEMTQPGSTLTVGTDAGEAILGFQGTIAGTNATLVKAGADYTLTLDGIAKGVTNVVVNEGTLVLRHPTARPGLVCRYSFDDPADFGHDDGPGGLHLSNVDTGTPTAVVGVSGKAIHFGGTTSPVVLGSGAHPRPTIFPSGNDSFTVSLWIRPAAAACTGQTALFVWGKGQTGKCSLLRFENANSLYWHFNGNAYQLLATCPTALGNGDWHHIVATYDGTTRVKTIYCDGAQISTMTIAAASVVDIDPTWRLELGRYAQSTAQAGRRYEGDMDEFMLFDYAWSAEEVAAEYNRTATPAAVSAAASLPAPVARWTFDGDDPLADTTGNAALHLSEATTNDNYNVTFVSGDAICGKAAKFAPKNGSGFLKLDTFPADIIPSGTNTFTAIARYRPDTAQVKNGALCTVGWGSIDNMSSGSLFRIGPYQDNDQSARFINGRGNGVYSDGAYCTSLGNDHTRWYTVAVVYQPSANGNPGVYFFYVDGTFAKNGGNAPYNLPAQDFAIGAGYNGTKAFSGLVDDVQIYDCALSDGQIRMIAEQLELSKGKPTTDAPVPAGVLGDTPAVTVASGATLSVASVESIGNLSGAGTVTIAAGARLNLAGTRGFSGTVTGNGVVGIVDNAVLDFGDGSAPLIDINRPLALGANVTIRTTAASDRFRLASATSFLGAENLATWTVAGIGNHPYNFIVTQDGHLDLSLISSSIIIFR